MIGKNNFYNIVIHPERILKSLEMGICNVFFLFFFGSLETNVAWGVIIFDKHSLLSYNLQPKRSGNEALKVSDYLRI